MRTDGVRTSTHNGKQQTARREVASFFDAVSASGMQPRLRFVTGICQFNIAGAGTWRVAISGGVPTVTEGAQDVKPPDCTFACDAGDFVRIIERKEHLNLMAAVLQGLVTITGDLAFAYTLLGGATVQRAGSGSALPR